jgi:hypothetical protein
VAAAEAGDDADSAVEYRVDGTVAGKISITVTPGGGGATGPSADLMELAKSGSGKSENRPVEAV